MNDILDDISTAVCEEIKSTEPVEVKKDKFDTDGICFGLVLCYRQDLNISWLEHAMKVSDDVKRNMSLTLGDAVLEPLATSRSKDFVEQIRETYDDFEIYLKNFSEYMFKNTFNVLIRSKEYMPNAYSVISLMNYIESELREKKYYGSVIGAYVIKPGKTWEDNECIQAIWPQRENEKQWTNDKLNDTWRLSVVYRVCCMLTNRSNILKQLERRTDYSPEIIMARKFMCFINNTSFKEENVLSYPPSHEFRILRNPGDYIINKKHIIELQHDEENSGIPVVIWNMSEKNSLEVITQEDEKEHFAYTYIRHKWKELKVRSIFFIRSDSNRQMNVLSIGVMLEPFYHKAQDTHFMFGFVHRVTADDFLDEDVHSMGILTPDDNLIKKFKYWQLPLLEIGK